MRITTKIPQQIHKILLQFKEAADVKIDIDKEQKQIHLTLNNDETTHISYKNYTNSEILGDSKPWLNKLKNVIKKLINNPSYDELYIVYLKDNTDISEIVGLETLTVKKILSEDTFFCYATDDEIKQFKNSNKDKIICEKNSYIERDPQEDPDPIDDKTIDKSTTSAVLSAGVQRIGAQTSLARQEDFEYSKDIHVFIMDGGIYNHKDLNIDIEYSRNFVPNDNNVVDLDKWEDTVKGHGTHVAGIVSAKDIGIAPGVKVIAHRVLGYTGYGQLTWEVESLKEIQKFKKKNPNAKIIVNMSLGGVVAKTDIGPPVSDTQIFKIHEELIIKLIREYNITFVTSAGNFTHNVLANIIGRCPDVITVGSYAFVEGGISIRGESNNNIAFFSNYGRGVDIMAPGVDIRSTEPNNSYGIRSGTSMAAPVVTGAIVLMLSVEARRNPNTILTPLEIKNRLREDATNSFNDSRNPTIILKNPRFSKCWTKKDTFSESECNKWWRETLPETYPYSVYIGRYTKDGETIQNY